MHVAPADLRAVRAGDALVRFAILGPMAFVDAELAQPGRVPEVQEPCLRPHTGMVVEGGFDLEHTGRRRRVDAGTAFRVASGAPHRHHLEDPVRVVAFETVDGIDTSDAALRRLGLVPAAVPRASALRLAAGPVPGRGVVQADVARLGTRLLTISRFGPRSGFATDWCDLPHWGSVVSGSVTIEWEDDVEVLTAGDVFRCPPGPPGHRILAAEPAVLIDLTPLEDVTPATRQIDWRRPAFTRAIAEAEAEPEDDAPLELARVV